MRKAASLAALLALPGLGLAQSASLWLVDHDTGRDWVAVPSWGSGTVDLDLMLSYSGAPEGNFSFGGFIYASRGGLYISARTYGSPFTANDTWLAPGDQFRGYLNLTSKNFGATATSGIGSGPWGSYVAPTDGVLPWRLMTITVQWDDFHDPFGTWLFLLGVFVGSTENGGIDPIELPVSVGTFRFLPEPASMLLLAGALPFLRRSWA